MFSDGLVVPVMPLFSTDIKDSSQQDISKSVRARSLKLRMLMEMMSRYVHQAMRIK